VWPNPNSPQLDMSVGEVALAVRQSRKVAIRTAQYGYTIVQA